MSTERMDVWRILNTFFVTGYVKPEKRSHPGDRLVIVATASRVPWWFPPWKSGKIPWINPINQSHYEMMVFFSPENCDFLLPSKETHICHPFSGNLFHSYGKSPFFMGKSTISTGPFFNSSRCHPARRYARSFSPPRYGWRAGVSNVGHFMEAPARKWGFNMI